MSKVFVDQIPPEGGRKYSITANPDGTSSIADVTAYIQEGTPWGASDANQMVQHIDDASIHAIPITHTLSGTVHTLTGLPTADGVYTGQFVAVADYNEGDTFAGGWIAKPNGEETALPDKAFVTGDVVSVAISVAGAVKKLGFKLGGGANQTLPPQIRSFAARYGDTEAELSWALPEIMDDYAGLLLVRKASSVPLTPKDGVQIHLPNTATTYTDTGLINGTTYYLRAFPYNDKRQYQTELTGAVVSVTPQEWSVFGVSIDLANSNPETAVTYTDDAVGMTPGSTAWESQPIFKDIKPCILKNGVVQYYLNPADLTKKADGTSADITSGNDGDVMIEIPKTGFKITTSGNTLTIRVTDNPNDTANFKYYAHTRAAEGDRSKLYIGAYLGSNVSSKLRSLSGKTPYASPTGPAGTIGTCRTMAQANGAGYDQVSFYPLTLLQCLFLIKYKHLNSQVALGRGYVDGNSAAIATGGTNVKGIDFGETTGKMQMCFLNIEDMWGNLRWWIDGFWSDASRNMWTAFTGFNDTGSGYTNRGQGATSNNSNYMSKPQGMSECGFIAKEVSGSSSTYFADYTMLRDNSFPVFGGHWGAGADAGVFCLAVSYTASGTAAYFGSRLMYL